MSSTPRFARLDTKRPDGFYVQFARVILDDDRQPRPDERDEGFWPSRNAKDMGYCPPEFFDKSQAQATSRMERFESGEWNYVGVIARALCMIARDGTGTLINLDSPGTWGIESDAGDYLNEVYAEQIAELKDMIAAMQNPIYEESK